MSADRAYSAAQAADDPLVMARASWYYAALIRAIGHHEDAVLELDSAIPLVRDRMEEDRESAATYVDLEMHAALTLARAGDESAWARWEKGHTVAHRLLPEGYAYPQTRIGRVMVELYAVMVAVALGHGDEARRRAATIDPASIPSTEQRAKHLVELARGYQFMGEELGVLHLLGQAADVSAETVIYSRPARALTRDLLRRAPAASREDVQRLASRIGIQEQTPVPPVTGYAEYPPSHCPSLIVIRRETVMWQVRRYARQTPLPSYRHPARDPGPEPSRPTARRPRTGVHC